MTAKTGMVDEYAFAAEGLAASACGAALRQVKSLAQSAPHGRAFAAIATLTEFSGRIEASLVASEHALSKHDEPAAARALDTAVALMDDMATAAAAPGDDGVTPRRQRSGAAA